MLLILNVLSVTLIINKLSTLPKNYKFFKRDYSKLDSEALISEVRNVNWSEVLGVETGATDVKTVFQNFDDRLTEIINKHGPIHKLSKKEIKSLSKPWVTPGIKTSIRNKDKFYKRFIDSLNFIRLLQVVVTPSVTSESTGR